jgi:hypothetical protein
LRTARARGIAYVKFASDLDAFQALPDLPRRR